jgi:hypothetical protein
MSRRDVLTAIELTLAASALTAGTYGLVIAAYDPYAAVTWVPIVAMGLGTAAAITVAAAVLFVGRAALLLAADAVQVRRDAAVPPPSASAPLGRPRPADEQAIDAYATPGTGRHGRGPSGTVPMPTEELAAAGGKPAGGGR